ncbi:hypothetical protein [Hymenobacter bucti]|uniref:Nucleotide-diphospho-sugar transferase domain-containing protein n=1 Tax=Hymenobacter bucti TaxID=1844114 RepID=A0ABW4QPI4_9BACT
MPAAPCSLIYLAYGSAALHAEAVYSLLSYYRVARPAAQVLIYTDAPAAFRQVLGERPAVHYPAVTPAEWYSWRGSSNKVYLLKIGVLTHAAQHYPGNLLFVDTDTIWQADPAPLFAQIERGQFVMHVSEGRLATGNELSRKIFRRLRGQIFKVGQREFAIDSATVLYNSGVLGLSSGLAAQLPGVVALADELYAAYDKHMMEQLAFSMWFGQAGAIAEAAPYVLHYWNLKAARPLLTHVFEQYAPHSLQAFYEKAEALDLAGLHKSEMRYRALPGWRRTLLKLVGRRWRMPALGQ